MKEDKAIVNPAMLKWARKVAGMSNFQASFKAGIHLDLLPIAEKEERILTIKQVRKLAEVYKIDSTILYLYEPPIFWLWARIKRWWGGEDERR